MTKAKSAAKHGEEEADVKHDTKAEHKKVHAKSSASKHEKGGDAKGDAKAEHKKGSHAKSSKEIKAPDVDEILEAAKERGIKLPAQEEAVDGVKDLIVLAKEHSAGLDVDHEAILAGCEHMWGLTPEQGKKRKAEIDARPDIGKKANVNKEPVEWPLTEHGTSSRELAERLRLEAISNHIKVPEDDTDAIVLCGQAALAAKTDRETIDVLKALEHLQEKCGFDDYKFRNLVGDVQVKENLPVVEMLRELAASYFKKGSEDRMNRIKGAMLQRAASAIRDLEWEIKPDHLPVASGKGKEKIKYVGHDTIEYIREFFETGKVTRLEEAKIEDRQKK